MVHTFSKDDNFFIVFNDVTPAEQDIINACKKLEYKQNERPAEQLSLSAFLAEDMDIPDASIFDTSISDTSASGTSVANTSVAGASAVGTSTVGTSTAGAIENVFKTLSETLDASLSEKLWDASPCTTTIEPRAAVKLAENPAAKPETKPFVFRYRRDAKPDVTKDTSKPTAVTVTVPSPAPSIKLAAGTESSTKKCIDGAKSDTKKETKSLWIGQGPTARDKVLQKQLDYISSSIMDNPFMTDEEKKELCKDKYHYDVNKREFDRDYEPEL